MSEWKCGCCTLCNKKFITSDALCEACHQPRKQWEVIDVTSLDNNEKKNKKRCVTVLNDASSSAIDVRSSKKRRVTMSNDTVSSSSAIDVCSPDKKRPASYPNDEKSSSAIDLCTTDNKDDKKNKTRIFGGDPSNRMNTTAAPMAHGVKRKKGGSQSKLNDTATSGPKVEVDGGGVGASASNATDSSSRNVSDASTSKATGSSSRNVSDASASMSRKFSAASASTSTTATVTSRNDSHPSAPEDDAAEKLNKDGIVLFGNAKYPEAAIKFRQALDITSISPETRNKLTNNLGKALIGIGSHNALLDALSCFTWCIEQLSSQEEERRIRYTLSRGMAMASILRFDECYLQQAIADLEYVFRQPMAEEHQRKRCIKRLKIIVTTMKELYPNDDAFPRAKGTWTPLEMECFDYALLMLGVDDLQKTPGPIAKLIVNSIPGRDYDQCKHHCKHRQKSKDAKKFNRTLQNQMTVGELKEIREGWESLDSHHREIEIELARAKLQLSKQRIRDEQKPVEPIVKAAFIAARKELQDREEFEPLNLKVTKPDLVLLSEYARHLNVEETTEAVLNDVDTSFCIRNAYDSIGYDIVKEVVRLLLPRYQSISDSKKEAIRKSIMSRFTFVDITALGLSVLHERDAHKKLRDLFNNTNAVNLNKSKHYYDEKLDLGKAVVNSKRTLVMNDDLSPGQHELDLFVDRHAKECNSENTTTERKEEILQNAISLFDKVIRKNDDGTFNLATPKNIRFYLRNRLIESSADLIPNSERKLAEAGEDDVIFTSTNGISKHRNHPGNVDLFEVVENNYVRVRYSSERKVAREIHQDIIERGGTVLYEKDGMLHECTTPRAIRLIAHRLNNKIKGTPIKSGSTEDIFLKELKAIDVDETTKDQPPEQKNVLKLKAAKKAVQTKDSPYRLCREFNATRRIMSRYRNVEKKGIRKDEVSTLVGLETVHLIDWFDKGMPDDCDWEQYLEGKVHIDHRQSLQGHIQKFGEKCVEQRWHFTNLWLLHGKKNSGKGGARGDDPKRKWNSEKNRWVETSEEDEKLVKEFIRNFGRKSEIMNCSA